MNNVNRGQHFVKFSCWKASIRFCRLTQVPVTKPTRPKTMMKPSFALLAHHHLVPVKRNSEF